MKQSKLASIERNLEESMGVRGAEQKPKLSPVPKAKDVGRRPARNFGTIPVRQIRPDPEQPRQEFDEESLADLAKSIKLKGQLQPIRVRLGSDRRTWTIIAGERRWRAAKMAGLETITCYFHDGEMSDSEVLEEQIIENIQRRSLQPMEEARAFAGLMELNGWNGKQVAEALGVHPAKVSRALSLFKLPVDLQTKVESGELQARTAYELSKLKTDDQRRAIAKTALNEGLSNSATASAVRQTKGYSKASSGRPNRLKFNSSVGCEISIGPLDGLRYEHIELAFTEALEEVRTRIENNVQI